MVCGISPCCIYLVLNPGGSQKSLKTPKVEEHLDIFLPYAHLFLYLCVLWCLYRKGTILEPAEVRNIVTEYVKKNELVDDNNKK